MWGYRPHLDGLRAVAVYLVLAFHSGADRLSGGFIGVDVFFVLSGYLVTQLLSRDLSATGSIRWGRFYSRRVRRLLPAAVVNLAVTAAVFAAIAPPARFEDAKNAIRAAALYASNWYFIGQATDYFAADINRSPVIQYWSLSVEEQFYLLWPLILFGVIVAARRLSRHERVATRSVVIAGSLLSLVAALLIARTNNSLAYFGTGTRAYQLLGGATLALTPELVTGIRGTARLTRWLPAIAMAALAGLLVASTNLVALGPITRGVVATALTMVLILSLESASGGLGRRLLSSAPITYLGKISYGTYLWHWLVILVITDAYALDPLTTFVVAAVIATGIASVSYQLLEQPIRSSVTLDRFGFTVIATGLAASLVVGVVVTPRIMRRAGTDTAALDSAQRTNGTPNRADWEAAKDDNFRFTVCPVRSLGQKPEACPLVQGSGKTIAVVGDSHATMLTPMISDLARRRGLKVEGAFLLACPWTWGIRYAAANPACFDNQNLVFDQILPEIAPDIVILAHRPVDDPTNGMALLDQRSGPLRDRAERSRALRASIEKVVNRLRAEGSKVVIVEPIPVPPQGRDPLDCLSTARFLEECRFVAPTGPTDEERIIRDVAKTHEGVWSLDLDRQVCPYFPICDPVVNGVVPRPDDNHITVTFGRTLGGSVEQFLEDNGALR